MLDECGFCLSARVYIVPVTQSFQQPPEQLSVVTSCTRGPDRRGRAQAQLFWQCSSYCHQRGHEGCDLVTAAGQVFSTNGAISLLMLPLPSMAASLASLASQDPGKLGLTSFCADAWSTYNLDSHSVLTPSLHLHAKIQL